MTNTLHRFGEPESLEDDYIVFMMASKGVNDENVSERVKAFLNAALKYKPINMGNVRNSPLYRPEKDLNITKLYFVGRREKIPAEQFIQELDEGRGAAVVFDNKEAMTGFLHDVKELDLGLSVNVSALADDVRVACRNNEITIHSLEYSLGFLGDTYRLPDRQVLALTTMCGHGMISATFAKKMIDRVKEARLTPEKAAGYMAKFCVCGVFNTARAARLLNEARMSA